MTLYTRHVSASGRVSYQPFGESWHPPAWPYGAHLVVVQPGLQSTMYRVEPTHAPLLVAAKEHEPEVVKVVQHAMSARPEREELTDVQRKAWEKLQATGVRLMVGSAQSVFDALVSALTKKALEAASR